MRTLPAAFCLLLVTAVAAQESPATWISRILDPASIGVAPYPGAEMNRKFSVDTIRLDKDPDRKIAVYLAPLEKLREASAHFAKELGIEPAVTGEGSEFETHTFTAPGKHLKVVITRSPWSTGNLQITMEHDPPGATPTPKPAGPFPD